MKPLTQGQQHASLDKRPLPCTRAPQHLPSESVVVVLAVMYPSVLPRLVAASTHPDLALPSLGLDTGRQSGDVIFYDPLSSQRNGDEASLASKDRKIHKGSVYENRAEAQKAVARDLTLLLGAENKVSSEFSTQSYSDATRPTSDSMSRPKASRLAP